MGVATVPAAAGGGIKSVQRGSAAGSGNVTITAVDIAKSFVTVFGTTSSGTVAASASVSGNINSASINGTGSVTLVGVPTNPANVLWAPGSTKVPAVTSGSFNSTNESGWTVPATINSSLSVAASSIGSGSLSGGSNNLVAAVVQGYLSNSTTLVVSGACRWEVVEFN